LRKKRDERSQRPRLDAAAPSPWDECMADYTKREQNRADVHHMIEAGIAPPRFPMPRCNCGELARFEVNQYPRIDFYCAKHLPTDALEPRWRGR
jgi:hypothetical protein